MNEETEKNEVTGIDPGRGYRLLKIGEEVEPGDELWYDGWKEWISVTRCFGRKIEDENTIIRRKIEITDPQWSDEVRSLIRELMAEERSAPMKIGALIEAVRKWGTERKIIGANARATIGTQLEKFYEESEELEAGIANGNRDEITDGIGDTTVTLILLAELHGVPFEECLQFAYNEIKGRTGKMVDGIFVKDKAGNEGGEA